MRYKAIDPNRHEHRVLTLGRERGDRIGRLLTAVPNRSDAVDVGDMLRRVTGLSWLDNSAIVKTEQRGGVLGNKIDSA
jgi:hypothetical protein